MKRKGYKYIAAGLVSWGFDYGTLMVLYYVVGLRISVATTAAFIVGFVVNFALIRYWVFDESKRGRQAALFQGTQYTTLTIFNLLITNLVIYGFSKHGIGPAISKIFTTALIACWNFVFYHKLIFKEKPHKEVAEHHD